MMRRLRRGWLVASAVAVCTCSSPLSPSVLRELSITVDWVAPGPMPISSQVTTPMGVIVTDADGRPVAGQVVAFNVTRGLGVLAVPDSVTDANGRASAGPWTLGYISGMQEVTAHLPKSTSDSRTYFRVISTP